MWATLARWNCNEARHTGAYWSRCLAAFACAASVGASQAAPSVETSLGDLAGVINVKSLGCRGDGVSDDTRCIQKAIEAAATVGVRTRPNADRYINDDRLGGTVYLPAGRYMINAPLVLPRSGFYPAHALTIRGENRESTIIAASSAFPEGRAVIEWERVRAKGVYGQKFVSFGIDTNSRSGVRGIWYAPVDKSTYEAMHLERMNECAFRDLVVFANSSATPSGIRIEGGINQSLFENITIDSVPGPAPRYSTVLLHFDDELYGDSEVWRLSDRSGMNYGWIQGLKQGKRGGRVTLIKGRLLSVSVSDLVHGVGALGRESALDIRNCACVSIRNAAFEGRSEDGIIRIDRCTSVDLSGIQPGITDEAPGVGIRITNSRGVRLVGRAVARGVPAFSANGSRLLSVDASSTDCRFESLGGNAAFDLEVEWRSNGRNRNYMSYVNVADGIVTVIDEVAGKSR